MNRHGLSRGIFNNNHNNKNYIYNKNNNVLCLNSRSDNNSNFAQSQKLSFIAQLSYFSNEISLRFQFA